MKTDNRKKLTICFVALLAVTVLMTLSVLLPYGSAEKEYRESLLDNADYVIDKDLNLTAGDMVDISMVTYARVYSSASSKIFGNAGIGIIYVIFVAAIGGFSLLCVLFALLKKPIPIIIFDILSFAAFMIQRWDYVDRRVIPSSKYDWGIGYYLFIVAAILAFALSIVMIIIKKKIKNEKTD